MLTLTYPFITPANYTYDSDKLEFYLVKEVEDGTFGVTFDSDIDADWGDGNLSGVSYNGATVLGGKLDLAHSDRRWVKYDAIDNADMQQAGCIRFKFTPNYITPVGESIPFCIMKQYNDTTNLIYYRDTGSHHRLHIYDLTGNIIEECYFNYKQWVAGQEYELEFNFDISHGAHRMFIDGVQQGSTCSGTGVRDSNINVIQLGTSYKEATSSNFKINDFEIFSAVQHTADYTPGYSVPDENPVISGKVELKDLTPDHEIFYANYAVDVNATRGNGNLTGTLYGGASVSGGKLDLTGGSLSYAKYNSTDNVALKMGAIRFKFTPNYSGSPSTQMFLFCDVNTLDSANTLELVHATNGQVLIRVKDVTGVSVINTSLASWTSVLGQEYEFELNYDFTNGITRLFIDGTQLGATISTTVNRTANGRLIIGSEATETAVFDGKFDDFQCFNAVQHTSTYLPITVQETKYDISNPTVIPNSLIITDGLLSFTSTVSESAYAKIKFVLSVDGVYKYWNGTAWVVSTGYSQSNTVSEINANLSSLDILSGVELLPIVYVHSEDGSTTPEIDLLTLGYDYFSPTPPDPSICDVWGYINNVFNEDEASVVVTVKLKTPKDKTTSKHIISPRVVSTTTNSLGYFDFNIIRSSEYEISGQYTFTFEYSNGEIVRYENVTIPDATSKNFWDLV